MFITPMTFLSTVVIHHNNVNMSVVPCNTVLYMLTCPRKNRQWNQYWYTYMVHCCQTFSWTRKSIWHGTTKLTTPSIDFRGCNTNPLYFETKGVFLHMGKMHFKKWPAPTNMPVEMEPECFSENYFYSSAWKKYGILQFL